MLALDALHAHYGLSHVLQGVSLAIGKGEVLGVFGRNGVGKTTLIKAVAGWVKPSAGSIRFEGADIAGLASDRICRLGIGLVPEDRRVFPGLTVEENLRLGLMQSPGRPRAEGNRAVERIFERFPQLAERRRQMGTTLSGGEQQMLAIARVLAGTPRLLLIDEPTEGLAPDGRGRDLCADRRTARRGHSGAAGGAERHAGAGGLRSLRRPRTGHGGVRGFRAGRDRPQGADQGDRCIG